MLTSVETVPPKELPGNPLSPLSPFSPFGPCRWRRKTVKFVSVHVNVGGNRSAKTSGVPLLTFLALLSGRTLTNVRFCVPFGYGIGVAYGIQKVGDSIVVHVDGSLHRKTGSGQPTSASGVVRVCVSLRHGLIVRCWIGKIENSKLVLEIFVRVYF